MADEKELYERKRLHDLHDKVYACEITQQVHEEKISTLMRETSEFEGELKKVIGFDNELRLRITQIENQVSTYNKVVWLLATAILTATTAWYLR